MFYFSRTIFFLVFFWWILNSKHRIDISIVEKSADIKQILYYSDIITKINVTTMSIDNHLDLTSFDRRRKERGQKRKRRLQYRHSSRHERGERRPKLVSGVPLGPHPE